MSRVAIYVLIVSLIVPSFAIAAPPAPSNIKGLNWGYNVASLEGYWTTPTDYFEGILPVADNQVTIYSGNPAKKCILDVGTPFVGNVRLNNGAVLEITPTGVLNIGDYSNWGVVVIGQDAGSAAELIIDGGRLNGTSTYASSTLRLGSVTGSSGILTIKNGGYCYTRGLMFPYAVGATARVNLYGGVLEVFALSWSAMEINYGARTGGSMDIRAPGKLILSGGWGDLRGKLGDWINRGLIFSSDPNTILVMSWDGNNNILQGITSSSDLNRDNAVDFKDFALFGAEWRKIRATSNSELNPNRVIFAPKTTSPITVDGIFDASEWANASEWAEFGKWYPRGQGLASTTKAKYAWNDDADMLYIAIESTEPNQFAEFELGGLMGDLTSDPRAIPEGNWQATQLHLQYNGSTVGITSSNYDYPGITTGVVAAQTWDGTALRLEIATPIYSDWCNAATKMNLSAGMDIYTYINIISSATDGIRKGDSQCAMGGQFNFFNPPASCAMEVSSAVRLLNSLPATCGDLPRSNYANFAGDCSVDFSDFAVFIVDWLRK